MLGEQGRGANRGQGNPVDAIGERARPAPQAACWASRVLPTPPGPTRVSRQVSGLSSRSISRRNSSSRPMKGVNWRGRLCARAGRRGRRRGPASGACALSCSYSAVVSALGSAFSSSARTWRQVGILGQRGAAVAAGRQQAHGLPVGFLAPRLQRQLPEGVLQGRGVLAAPGVVGGQAAQRLHRRAVQAFAREHQPFLKRGAIGQVEAAQQIAPVQRGGLLQAGVAGGAALQVAVAVRPAGGEQVGEAVDIHLAHRRADRAAPSWRVIRRKPGALVVLAQRLAQLEQGVAQVAPRRVVRQFGPQQAGQGFAARAGCAASTPR